MFEDSRYTGILVNKIDKTIRIYFITATENIMILALFLRILANSSRCKIFCISVFG